MISWINMALKNNNIHRLYNTGGLAKLNMNNTFKNRKQRSLEVQDWYTGDCSPCWLGGVVFRVANYFNMTKIQYIAYKRWVTNKQFCYSKKDLMKKVKQVAT